ncbi:hypothetical protein DSL92_08780 [Billgrantia gudaonensis]|uniref:Uncharacterized protein n=1 Tax=Billgrantia gudaonensis TaxID=376427 RepID=A0A432JGK2_9GAMM|nr:hypothetical protein DSL92_08780 [Halomonas gudaonensis]
MSATGCAAMRAHRQPRRRKHDPATARGSLPPPTGGSVHRQPDGFRLLVGRPRTSDAGARISG